MNYPDVSIIIPTYNNGYEISRAIDSILTQEEFVSGQYTFEIIVVNDASEGKFLANLEKLTADYQHVKLLHLEKQLGPGAARNYGIRESKGRIIGFLDADDEWAPNKIKLLLPLLSKKEIDVVGGKIKYIIQDGIPSPVLQYEDEYQTLTHVHLGALLLRRAIFDKGLYFNETLSFSEDIDWWLRLRENNIGIEIIEDVTLLYHVHGNNMSVNKGIKELQVLKILYESLKRRRENTLKNLPQVKDFRIHQPDPLISIIIPLYNGKTLIKKAMNSVFAQTYTNWELLIIDDGSTDGGAEWISNHYPSAKIIKQENKGVAAARNKGIELSNGDVIAFLDQDDEWLPAKLREQWNILKNDPYCAFVTCNQRFVCYEHVLLPANFDDKLKEEHQAFVPSALLIRKHALTSAGGFDIKMEVSSDMDLIRRLRNAGFKEENVNQLLLFKWYHGNNASLNKRLLRNELLTLLHKQIHGK